MLNTPYDGKTFWRPVPAIEPVEVPCPVCARKLKITIILGSGEQVEVPCEGCGLGFEGPRGYVREYTHEATIEKFEVKRLLRFDADRCQFYLESTTGDQAEASELFDTEELAMAEAVKRCAEWEEGNMRSRQRKRENAKKGGWTVRYHRDCIKDLERQLAWHKAKVTEKSDAQ